MGKRTDLFCKIVGDFVSHVGDHHIRSRVSDKLLLHNIQAAAGLRRLRKERRQIIVRPDFSYG